MSKGYKKKMIGVRSQEIENGAGEQKEKVYRSADHTCILKGPFPIEYTGEKKEDAEK